MTQGMDEHTGKEQGNGVDDYSSMDERKTSPER